MIDTMRPIRETIPLAEALALLLDAAVPIERRETVPLEAAAGRVIAAPPAAGVDVPGFDRAAMDGFAVRADDRRKRVAVDVVDLSGLERLTGRRDFVSR